MRGKAMQRRLTGSLHGSCKNVLKNTGALALPVVCIFRVFGCGLRGENELVTLFSRLHRISCGHRDFTRKK